MTPEKFIAYVENPMLLDAASADELRELTREYPYFQAARMLLAKNHQSLNPEAYEVSLRLAAAYTPDRSRLKSLIENIMPVAELQFQQVPTAEYFAIETSQKADSAQEVPDIGIMTETHVSDESKVSPSAAKITESFAEPEEINPCVEQNISATPLIDQIRSRLSANVAEADTPKTAQETLQDTGEEAEPALSRAQLVEKFIRDEPRIAPMRKEFFHPDDIARQSMSLPDDLASETLAQIFESQGHTEFALKIYQKLSLFFPEKRSYFAARIEELEKKRK